MAVETTKTWTLIGSDERPYESTQPGSLGGHSRTGIFGQLDCPLALRAIARGGYVKHRVFFINEAVARAVGYRPCAVCLPEQYSLWKAAKGDENSLRIR